MNEQHNPPSSRGKRPAGLASLTVVFSLVGLFHLLKFLAALLDWTTLSSLDPLAPLAYLAGDGLLWFVVCLTLAWGIWQGTRWAKPASQVSVLLYALASWADRLWIANPEKLARRWPVNLLVTAAGLGLVLWILNHPASRKYFQENPAKIP